MREGAAPRPLPELHRPPHQPAAPPRRRHVRGHRLGHGHRRDRRALHRHQGAPTAARRSSTTAAAARGTTSAAATAARTRAALGSRYASNALAQEKTGEFWVDGQLFGKPQCHTTGDYEHAEVAVFLGKNPWQSHGFPRARPILKAIANDPDRCLIVIDPRRTETAELADIHLQVKPGTDAWCLTALLAILFEEDLRRPRASSTEHANRARGARRPDRHRRHRPQRGDLRRRRGPAAHHRPADGRGVEHVDLRGPRRPAGAAQHAQLVAREAGLAGHRQLRQAGGDEPPHRVRPARSAAAPPRRPRPSAGTASSPGWSPPR